MEAPDEIKHYLFSKLSRPMNKTDEIQLSKCGGNPQAIIPSRLASSGRGLPGDVTANSSEAGVEDGGQFGPATLS